VLQAAGPAPNKRLAAQVTLCYKRRRGRLVRGYPRGVARIEGYEFGRVLVDGGEHRTDVIVLPGRVVSGWRRREGHGLVLEDLEEVLDELPGRLVIGTGAYGRLRPDPDALEALRGRGIEVDALPTGEAVRLFAELEPTRTAAALHLTC
jgi:hypothetical protein